MKTIKCIFADGLKLDYYKTKKDYIVYLATKSYKNFDNLGGKLPRLGVKFAKLNGKNEVEFYERVQKDRFGKHFKLIGTFNFTEIEKTATNIIVKKQKYIHRDIIQDKKECELFFEDGTRQIVSGVVLINHLFNGSPLGCSEQITPEMQPKNECRDILSIPDWELSGEQLFEKMQKEIQMGICPF